jgi:hypothetical protein
MGSVDIDPIDDGDSDECRHVDHVAYPLVTNARHSDVTGGVRRGDR